MNTKQQIALLLIAAVVLLMLLFPPFHLNLQNRSINQGYSFILRPSDERATVNIGMLLVQWLGVLILGGISYYLFKDRK